MRFHLFEMINYGIFGFRESTSLFGRTLRAKGCPIVAVGEKNTSEKAICKNPSNIEPKGAARFFCGKLKQVKPWNLTPRSDPHKDWLPENLKSVCMDNTLWEMIQKRAIGAIILGEDNPITLLRECIQSRNAYILSDPKACDRPRMTTIAVDISAVSIDESAELDKLIELLEDDVQQAKNQTPRRPYILVKPGFFMQHDPVHVYTSAIASQAVGDLKHISLIYRGAGTLERWRERKFIPGAHWLHATDLIRYFCKDDFIEKAIPFPRGPVQLSESTQFTTKQGIQGNALIHSEFARELLSVSLFGPAGYVELGKTENLHDQVAVRVMSRNEPSERDELSRSFRSLLPKNYPAVRSSIDYRWGHAMKRFLESLVPKYVRIEDILQDSLNQLYSLKKTIQLARFLFMEKQ